MPAAAWAAKSGDAVLFTERDSLPQRDQAGDQATRAPAHLRARARERVISSSVERSLRRLGRVKRMPGPHTGRPTRSRSRATRTRPSAGESATRATASCSRTPTAPATRPRRAALGGSGKYGPLLLLDECRRASPPARELPARHPARLPLRPRARRLQSRLDAGRRVRDQPRRAGAGSTSSPRSCACATKTSEATLSA